eukprot:6083649-Pyramimonas_sp.AAC.1
MQDVQVQWFARSRRPSRTPQGARTVSPEVVGAGYTGVALRRGRAGCGLHLCHTPPCSRRMW